MLAPAATPSGRICPEGLLWVTVGLWLGVGRSRLAELLLKNLD